MTTWPEYLLIVIGCFSGTGFGICVARAVIHDDHIDASMSWAAAAIFLLNLSAMCIALKVSP